MSSPDLFTHCREEFASLTVTSALSLEGVHHWSQGRSEYAVWAIEIDDPAILQRLCAVQAVLGVKLATGYARHPHITLAPCGFPAVRRHHGDDYVVAAYQAQIKDLRSSTLSPFKIAVGGPNSFSCAPFLEVLDDKRELRHLHHQLQIAAPSPSDYLYVAHLTAGLYSGQHLTKDVLAMLDTLPRTPIYLEVSRIALLTYDFHVLGGKLSKMCELDLATGQVTWTRALWPASQHTVQCPNLLEYG